MSDMSIGTYVYFKINLPGEPRRYEAGPILARRPGYVRSEWIITVQGEYGIWHLFETGAYAV